LAEFAGLENLRLEELLRFSFESFSGKANSLPAFSF
jgi:hypothetical protein